jgi:hypothetical protein
MNVVTSAYIDAPMFLSAHIYITAYRNFCVLDNNNALIGAFQDASVHYNDRTYAGTCQH